MEHVYKIPSKLNQHRIVETIVLRHSFDNLCFGMFLHHYRNGVARHHIEHQKNQKNDANENRDRNQYAVDYLLYHREFILSVAGIITLLLDCRAV